MDKFVKTFYDLVTQSMNQVFETMTKHGPGIAFAISVVIFGWISALLVKKIISKLLKALGFNVLIEKTGLKRILDRGEVKHTPSTLVGMLFYWIIIINSLIVASDAVDLELTSKFIQQAIFYIPKVIVVTVFIAIAVFIANTVYKIVEKTARAAGVPMYKLIGNIARYAVVGLAVMLILEYLKFKAAIIMQVFAVIFIVIPLGFFIVLLAGGRDLITGILVRRYILKEYKKGDTITFDSITGVIESMDSLTTRLKDGNEEITIPNAELARKIIRKK